MKMKIILEDTTRISNFNFIGIKRNHNRKKHNQRYIPSTLDKPLCRKLENNLIFSPPNKNCNFNLKKLKNRIKPKFILKNSDVLVDNPCPLSGPDEIEIFVRPDAPHNTSTYLIDNFIRYNTNNNSIDDLENSDDTFIAAGSMVGNLNDPIDLRYSFDWMSNAITSDNIENKSSSIYSTSEIDSVQFADDECTDSSYNEKFKTSGESRIKLRDTCFTPEKKEIF
jgi:hypothetical protein